MSDGAILLVGATGLVGRSIIAQKERVPQMPLVGLSRREMEFPDGVRMELVLAEPEAWGGVVDALKPKGIICALGTTRSKAGSEDAFRAVDHDLVMQVARKAKAVGTRRFVLVSSVGADIASRNFYLRVKGEVERDLRALRLARLDILRPGLLRGQRQGDTRFLEGMARGLAPVTDLFLRGDRTKYRSIQAEQLAAAALQCIREKANGQFIHEHEALQRLAARFDRNTGED